MRKTAKPSSRRLRKGRGPSDRVIKATYARLGLRANFEPQQNRTNDYARPFERCSMLEYSQTTYSAHSGV
jgi:hypothetical protein